MRRKGSHSSKTLRGPELTTESLPALITLALPDTGAARKAMPFAASAARIAAEASIEIDEQSTTMRGCSPGVPSRPPGPDRTSPRSLRKSTLSWPPDASLRSTGKHSAVVRLLDLEVVLLLDHLHCLDVIGLVA